MKKKVLLLVLMAGMFVGCSSQNSSSTVTSESSSSETSVSSTEASVSEESKSEESFVSESVSSVEVAKELNYKINVFDLDGEDLGHFDLNTKTYSTLWDGLVGNYDVDYYDGPYGHTITSINHSIVDANYYVAIYKNGQPSDVGIDSVVISEGDVFDFKVECWNTVSSGYGVLDDYEVKLDKALYHYVKTKMKSNIEGLKTYTGSSYWDMLTANLLSSEGYDANLFNYNLSSELVESLTSADVSKLSGADWGKYYTHARIAKTNLDSFKTAYENFVENDMPSSFNEWTTPFYLIPAKGLNINSAKINAVCEAAVTTNLAWGPDGAVWQYCGEALFKEMDTSLLDMFVTKSDWGNGASTSLAIAAFTSSNVNVRDSKYEIEGKDLLESLFDNYYSEDLNIVKWGATDTDYAMSSNQIYTALATYKVFRDKQKAANLFQ